MSFFNRFSAFFLPLLFFVIGLVTLYDYGINWDSPVHFARGQAYLQYILTGKTNYDGLPRHCMNADNLTSRVDYETGELCDRHRKVRVSEYESNLLDFNSWVAKAVYGHPAFSDVMLAASNMVFFKYLGWVEDISAYHLYSLFTTFLLALTVSVWAKQTFGTFASMVAVLVVYSFPLLFGEQHFNVKDPPMAAFFTIALYFFWLSFVRKKARYLILSALAGGTSFGTKFNFVFAPFILLPWIIAYGATLLRTKTTRAVLSRKMLLAFSLYPIIVFLVFFLSWPALWENPLKNIPQVFKFYQDIGSPSCGYPYFTYSWFTRCTETTTLKYLLYTIPPFSLLLFSIGLIAGALRAKTKNYVTILWISFFLLTIIRVTISISNIYGGLRQIMEFIAPFAMIAAIGALFTRNILVRLFTHILKSKKPNKSTITIIASTLLILGFVPIGHKLIQIHPNQNVYFNFLIGGLKGAAERNFPGYGNTYGNAYLPGIKWLNQHAEPSPKLALVSGNAQNISRVTIREDIDFSNGSRSGYNQEGEYQMLLVTAQDQFSETFRYKYLDMYLDEIYTVKVENIPLLKIWKNDKKYLKDGVTIDHETKEKIKTNSMTENGRQEIIIGLSAKKNLKAISFTFPNADCKEKMVGAKIYISANGGQYTQKADSINGFTEREINSYKTDFVYLFAGDEGQYIKITPPANYPCKLSDIDFSVFTF